MPLFLFVRKHPLATIMLLAAGMRLATWYSFSRMPDLYICPDSPLYIQLGHNLADRAVFQESLEPGSPPQTFRTPGYPAFLALCFLLCHDSIPFVALAQIGLGVMSVFFVWRFGCECFHPYAGAVAAMLMAFSPNQILHDNLILSENLCTFLLLAGVYGLWRFVVKGSWLALIGSGAMIGASVLTRPIGLLYWGIALVFLFIGLYRHPRRMLISISIWMTVYGAVVGGWLIRNYWRIGKATIATIGGYNLLESRGGSVRMIQTGETYEKITPKLYAELDERCRGKNWTEVQREAEARRLAFEIVCDHPWLFSRAILDSFRRLYMGKTPAMYQPLLMGVSSFKPESKVQWLIFYPYIRAQLAALLFAYLLLFVALGWMLHNRLYPNLILFSLTIIYPFALLFGACTVSYRYRVPFEPYIAILAGGGLAVFAFRMLPRPAPLAKLTLPLRVAVCIPVYNEAEKIKRLLDEFPFDSVEKVYVIDDGSNDGTEKLLHDYPVEIIRHDMNQGIGSGIREAVARARAAGMHVLTVMAGNGKDDPREIPIVTGPIAEGRADYVQGSRFKVKGYHENTPKFRAIAIRVYTWIFNFLSPYPCTDLTNGYRAYRLDLFDDARINLAQRWLDRYEMEYYIHFKTFMLGYRVEEVAVHKRYPAEKTVSYTKIRPLQDWWKMVRPMVYLFLRVKR